MAKQLILLSGLLVALIAVACSSSGSDSGDEATAAAATATQLAPAATAKSVAPTPTATLATEATGTSAPEPRPTATSEPSSGPPAVPIATAPPPIPTAIPAPNQPRITPDEGTYRGPTTISIEADSPVVYYTTDGSVPTLDLGIRYEGNFEIFDSTTVIAVAFDRSGAGSESVETSYEIEKPATDRPSIQLPGGLYIGAKQIAVTNNEPDGVIRYTLDGSDPSPENGLIYQGPVLIESAATLKVAVVRPGFLDSDIVEATYRILTWFVESSEPITLSGDDEMIITDTHFLHRGPITLSGNAKLIFRNSVIEHVKDFAFEYELKATENSQVIVENSGIGTSCNGSFNWAFFDTASLVADGMDPTFAQCNTWNFMSGSSNVDVTNWRTFSGTVCDQTNLHVRDSEDLEIELCMPSGTVVDLELPTVIDHFSFSGEDDPNTKSTVVIENSTVDGWGINVHFGSDITIRNSPAITVGIIVGRPWRDAIIEIEGIGARQWDDTLFDIGGSKLRLVNTYTYGWEPNVFADNTLIIRDSDYSGSAVNGGAGHYIIENSRIGQLVAFDNVVMDVTNSVIVGDVIANGTSVINLIDSKVGEDSDDSSGNVFARDNGLVVLQNTPVHGDRTTQDGGVISEE